MDSDTDAVPLMRLSTASSEVQHGVSPLWIEGRMAEVLLGTGWACGCGGMYCMMAVPTLRGEAGPRRGDVWLGKGDICVDVIKVLI